VIRTPNSKLSQRGTIWFLRSKAAAENKPQDFCHHFALLQTDVFPIEQTLPLFDNQDRTLDQVDEMRAITPIIHRSCSPVTSNQITFNREKEINHQCLLLFSDEAKFAGLPRWAVLLSLATDFTNQNNSVKSIVIGTDWNLKQSEGNAFGSLSSAPCEGETFPRFSVVLAII
jgi:hypothetical protein